MGVMLSVISDRSSPRQIRRLEFVPIKRGMKNQDFPARYRPDPLSSVLQVNLLKRDDPDWELLKGQFGHLSFQLGVTIQAKDDVSATLVAAM